MAHTWLNLADHTIEIKPSKLSKLPKSSQAIQAIGLSCHHHAVLDVL